MVFLISTPPFSDLLHSSLSSFLCIGMNLEPSFILTGFFLRNSRTESFLFSRDKLILDKNLPRV